MTQRGGEDPAVDLGQRLAAVGGRGDGDIGEPPQDLRQDDAGVAARTVQCARGERGRHQGHVVDAGARRRPAPTPHAS